MNMRAKILVDQFKLRSCKDKKKFICLSRVLQFRKHCFWITVLQEKRKMGTYIDKVLFYPYKAIKIVQRGFSIGIRMSVIVDIYYMANRGKRAEYANQKEMTLKPRLDNFLIFV